MTGNSKRDWHDIKRLLNDPASRVEGLTRLGRSSLRYAPSRLADFLADPDEQVRLQALHCLRIRGSRNHARRVTALLTDDSWRVRIDALICLTSWRAKGQLGAIKARLDDPDEHVRLYAARAVGALGSVKDVALLRGKLAAETSAKACIGHCVALARLTRQVAWLEEVAEWLTDSDESLRCVAANSLMDAATRDTAGQVASLLRQALAGESAAKARHTLQRHLRRLQGAERLPAATLN